MDALTRDKLWNVLETVLKPYPVGIDAVERIYHAYTEPWREYHNGYHITHMYNLLQQLDVTEGVRSHTGLLIIYHDAWYKVGRPHGENERMSVQWALNDFYLRRTADEKRLRRMLRQGIKATITHTLDQVKPEYVEEASLLLDLDLWGLGQSPEFFEQNTEAIWREYQPIATREEFDSGRARWAESFLQRDVIYHTEHFRHLEEQARKNLSALIE